MDFKTGETVKFLQYNNKGILEMHEGIIYFDDDSYFLIQDFSSKRIYHVFKTISDSTEEEYPGVYHINRKDVSK